VHQTFLELQNIIKYNFLTFFSSEQLGKPAAADLELGLATARVLFACSKFP